MRSTHSPLAALCLLAACLAALVSALHRFEHDSWLIVYLFLVGFAAQFLLGRGQAALAAPPGPSQTRYASQALLWNAGVILVPAGVLIEARLLVVVGGVTLLGALTEFAQSAGETRPQCGRDLRRQWRGQVTLIAFMTTSVFVGAALAWDTPWL